jgi:hypothetical protein
MVKKRQTAIQKVKERSLVPTPDQVLSYPADEVDKLLAEACLSGFGTFKAMAEFADLDPNMVRERLLDPVRCAWISKYIDELVPTRLGTVLGAVFGRAVSTGDPSSAKMLLQQYKKWTGEETKKSVNLNVGVDLGHLTNEQLKLFITEELKANQDIVIDADFKEKTEEPKPEADPFGHKEEPAEDE